MYTGSPGTARMGRGRRCGQRQGEWEGGTLGEEQLLLLQRSRGQDWDRIIQYYTAHIEHTEVRRRFGHFEVS